MTSDGLSMFAMKVSVYPTIEVAWISFPMTTFYNLDGIIKEPNLVQTLGRVFGGPNFIPVMTFFGNTERRDFTFFTVDVSNKSNRRTKEIEISGSALCCYLVSGGVAGRKFRFGQDGPITLPALHRVRLRRCSSLALRMLTTKVSHFISFRTAD